jgi:hypothetical protein
MFEWVCPKCDRTVLAELKVCPHCAAAEAEAAAAPAANRGARPRARFGWADVERGFRFGLGFLAALAIGYLVLFGAAWAWDNHDWMERLTRWLRMR